MLCDIREREGERRRDIDTERMDVKTDKNI